jgi:hypothetical protein
MADHPSATSVKVSVGQGVSFTEPNKIHLADIYNNFIRNPKASHVPAIKELREFVDQHINRLTAIEEVPESKRTEELKAERKWIKTNLNTKKEALRAFTWSGLFSARKNEGLIEHSGRLQGDIDMKMLPRIFSEQLRDRLGEDPHIEVAFLSPSGRGVKVGILIPQCSNNKEQHRAFAAANRYIQKKYEVSLDPSRKDLSGICFFSHDPQLIINFNAVPLDIEKWSPENQKPLSLLNLATHGKTSTEPQTEEKEPLKPPESTPSTEQQNTKQSTQEYDNLSTDDLVDILKSIQGADDRDVWIKVGHALKQYFGDDGYPIWASWSKQSSKWDDVDESKNRKKWDGFAPTNSNGQATLIYLAKKGGWKWKKKKQEQQARTKKKTSAVADHPAQEEKDTSTETKTEATEKDSADEKTPSTATKSDAGGTTKGNFHIEKNKSGEDVYVPNHHNINEFFDIEKFPIWYDTFTRQILTTMGQDDGTVVEWSDALTINLTMNFQSVKGMRRLSRNIVDDIIHMYSKQKPRNQLTDWLSSLQWDKTPRLDHWLSSYCRAEDNIYVREAGRCWLLGAVTRAYEPGTQFDHCLIFEGPQGSGKSSAIRILSNGWFAELESFTGKESAEVLAGGVWLVELSELDGMKKSDVESVKRFITTLTDRYRPAYGRHVVSIPRSCVFAGSTNESSYLRDSTGNRRFWPVKCGDIDLEQLRANRDLLIAEAVHRYKQGESLLMNQEAREIAVEAQEDRFQVDSWEDDIRKYIENKKEVAMSDVLETGLSLDNKSLWTRATETRIGNILMREGWKRRRVREGKQRVYRYFKET